MFTPKEEKNLSYVLSKSPNQESVLFMEELHGLLFGLALTPEPVMPSEWLPTVFPEEPQFDDLDDANTCMGHLFTTYNRLVGDYNKDKLVFPFNMKEITAPEYCLIEGWVYGFFLALQLRPDLWRLSDEYMDADPNDLPKEYRDLVAALSVIMSIALPEERDELFQVSSKHPLKDPTKFQTVLYTLLPQAVEDLKKYSAAKRKEILSTPKAPQRPAAPVQRKPGPNEPCPCGSGRKYKKCCGSN
jgi:uncharacterized protein